MSRDATVPDLERVWVHAIIPLLEEHYFGTQRDVEGEFGLSALRKALGPGLALEDELGESEGEDSSTST
jgi:hypothetical protein